MLIWHPFTFRNVKKIQRLPGLYSRVLTEIIMSSIKATRKKWQAAQENEMTFSCALCALIRGRITWSDLQRRSDVSYETRRKDEVHWVVVFSVFIKRKAPLSLRHITASLHYTLQMTRVKGKRMMMEDEDHLTALNGIRHTRQKLSESIFWFPLVCFFILSQIFSLVCSSSVPHYWTNQRLAVSADWNAEAQDGRKQKRAEL